MKTIVSILLLALGAVSANAAGISTNNGDGTFTFGVEYTVPTAAAQNNGTVYDRDITGVSDSIGVGLGLYLVCDADAIALNRCVQAGDLYTRWIPCTEALVMSTDCTQQQLDNGDDIEDPTTILQAFDAWILRSIRDQVKRGRDEYAVQVAASNAVTTEVQ